MAVSADDRRTVYERDGGQCLMCGATDGLTIQHRANRGMGGSALRDNLGNLITLCALDNVALEANALCASVALENGWKVPQYLDPLKVPVTYPDGRFLLDDEGGRVRVSPELPAAPVSDVGF